MCDTEHLLQVPARELRKQWIFAGLVFAGRAGWNRSFHRLEREADYDCLFHRYQLVTTI